MSVYPVSKSPIPNIYSEEKALSSIKSKFEGGITSKKIEAAWKIFKETDWSNPEGRLGCSFNTFTKGNYKAQARHVILKAQEVLNKSSENKEVKSIDTELFRPVKLSKEEVKKDADVRSRSSSALSNAFDSISGSVSSSLNSPSVLTGWKDSL